MGQEYSMAVRSKAKELYTVTGLNYEEVADAVKELFPPPTPSLSQIKRWAKMEGWRSRKEKLRMKAMELEEGIDEFKKLLLDLCIAKLKSMKEGNLKIDSQTLFGMVQVGNMVSPKKMETTKEALAPDIDRPALFLEDLTFIANILKEIDPEGLKVFARNFDLFVARFKAKHVKST
jgi:hypothetical protein